MFITAIYNSYKYSKKYFGSSKWESIMLSSSIFWGSLSDSPNHAQVLNQQDWDITELQ